jgi:hypothetical protein
MEINAVHISEVGSLVLLRPIIRRFRQALGVV